MKNELDRPPDSTHVPFTIDENDILNLIWEIVPLWCIKERRECEINYHSNVNLSNLLPMAEWV